jgi:hypothetical protein
VSFGNPEIVQSWNFVIKNVNIYYESGDIVIYYLMINLKWELSDSMLDDVNRKIRIGLYRNGAPDKLNHFGIIIARYT